MKALEISELQFINGGDWKTFVDGACTAYTAAVFLDVIPAKLVGDVACLGWVVYRGVSS